MNSFNFNIILTQLIFLRNRSCHIKLNNGLFPFWIKGNNILSNFSWFVNFDIDFMLSIIQLLFIIFILSLNINLITNEPKRNFFLTKNTLSRSVTLSSLLRVNFYLEWHRAQIFYSDHNIKLKETKLRNRRFLNARLNRNHRKFRSS